MKNYWDYTDQEQSELTEEQVSALLDVELMTNGVKKPVAPVLIEIPKSPLGEKQKKFAVHYKGKYGSDERADAVFNTLEQAQAFIDLCPSFQSYDYEVGEQFHYLKAMAEAKICAEEYYTESQINEFRSELKSRKAKTEANDKAQSAFRSACDKSEKITSKVWDNWHAMRLRRRELQEITTTYKEYVRLSSGNEIVALNFLLKTYKADDVEEAQKWFPNDLPPIIQLCPPATEQPKE